MGKKKSDVTHDTYRNATGPIPYNMLNDYMFRVVLQKNEFVLRGLIGSLLHLDQSDIESVQITNPIKFGEQISSKTFILDIHVRLNNAVDINLEMSEFYASYRMMNVKNHHIYSHKLQIHVLELNQTELATEEDRQYEIDRWAKLFKAATWEDLRMIAEKNKYMSEAAEEMYQLNEDEIIREQCMAREEYYRQERRTQRRMQELEAANAEKDAALAEKDAALAEKDRTLDMYQKRIQELEAKLADK